MLFLAHCRSSRQLKWRTKQEGYLSFVAFLDRLERVKECLCVPMIVKNLLSVT